MNKTRTIAFRLTDEEYSLIENAAVAAGENPNDWSRGLCLAEAGQGDGLSRNERLLYEELARVRYLVGTAFSLIAERKLSPEEWEKQRKTAEEMGAEIARSLLAKKKS